MHKRGKRSIYKNVKKIISRIQRGLENVLDAYYYNMIKGIRKVVMAKNTVQKTIGKVISEALEDIDRRLNRSGFDAYIDDEEEEEEPSENDLLVNYCFGPIMGPHFGVRTLLEYEEQCEEGISCESDIESSDDDFEPENRNFSTRGNSHP